MPYNGPVWQSTAGADKRGEIYMQAGQNIGNSLAQGIAAMGEKRKELASKAEAVQATEGAWDVLSAQHPDLLSPFEEKFRTGSAGAKQGILAQAIAAIGHKMEAGKEAESARRFGMDYSLRTANAANTAVYQQAQVDNMAADNSRQEKRLDYDLMPDNQQPVTMDLPGATAYGVEGEKSGTRIFNFIPKPKPAVEPGMVIGKDGIGYFAGSDGRPVNPEYLLADPVAGAPRGNDTPLGTDLLPVPSDSGQPPALAPATELPAGKPYSRPELVVPRRQPAAPQGWQLRPSADGMFAVKGEQVAKWDQDKGQWTAVDMPAPPGTTPAAAAPASPATAAPKRWR